MCGSDRQDGMCTFLEIGSVAQWDSVQEDAPFDFERGGRAKLDRFISCLM
jgi:hypothetical protein